MTFGERLKQLRISKGLSQEELGRQLKIKRSTVSMYECDNREPDFEMLEAIADFFNVDLDSLVSGASQKTSPYYLNEETAALAQQIHDDPDLRVLMDASKKLSPEELKAVIAIIKTMKGIE